MPLIRCMRPFKTNKGHQLPCNGISYNFLPNKYGHYVANVRDEDVLTVLSIGQGYQRYDEAKAAAEFKTRLGAERASGEDAGEDEDDVVVIAQDPTEEGEAVTAMSNAYLRPSTTEFKGGGRKPDNTVRK